MTTHSSIRHDMRGWLESRIGGRAITLAGLSVTGIVLLVLGFALDIVEPADSYTDSWAKLVWGAGIWVCAVAAFVAGLVAIVRSPVGWAARIGGFTCSYSSAASGGSA